MSCGICARSVFFVPGQVMRCPHCRWRLWLPYRGQWVSVMPEKFFLT